MRYQFLIAASMASVVAGRRGSPAPPPPAHRHHKLQPWGVQEPLVPEPSHDDKLKQVKQVKKGMFLPRHRHHHPDLSTTVPVVQRNPSPPQHRSSSSFDGNEELDVCSKSFLTYID